MAASIMGRHLAWNEPRASKHKPQTRKTQACVQADLLGLARRHGAWAAGNQRGRVKLTATSGDGQTVHSTLNFYVHRAGRLHQAAKRRFFRRLSPLFGL
jgi:hypothetical protein